jgi:hypothetical protein
MHLLWCRSVFIAKLMHLPPLSAGDDETRSSLCTTLLAGAEELGTHCHDALHFLTDEATHGLKDLVREMLLILMHT